MSAPVRFSTVASMWYEWQAARRMMGTAAIARSNRGRAPKRWRFTFSKAFPRGLKPFLFLAKHLCSGLKSCPCNRAVGFSPSEPMSLKAKARSLWYLNSSASFHTRSLEPISFRTLPRFFAVWIAV